MQPLPAPGNSPANEESIVAKRYAADPQHYIGYILHVNGSGQLEIVYGDAPINIGGIIVAAGPNLYDGKFHHVACSVQRGSATGGQLFVDGTNVSTFDTTTHLGSLSNSESLLIGSQNTAGYVTPFNGTIDELSLYQRALSASDVAAIYNAGSAGKCSLTPAVSAVPAIYNVAPASGTNGAVVTIFGTNFSATASANIVYFGAVQAYVIAANPVALTVLAPVSATFSPITVTVGGLTAASSRPFMPTYNGGGSTITTGSFAPSFNLGTPNGPGQTVIADLDGDGKPDLIVVNVYNNSLSIFRNISTNGTLSAGSFAPRVDIAATSGTYSPNNVTVADVDGDGKLDIIVTEFGDNLVSVYRNTSTPGNLTSGSFATRVDFATGVQPQGIAVCDLDGDGRPDIIAANTTDGTISILRNTGTIGTLTTNSFAPKVDITTGAGADRVAVGDLNGDGRPDLAVANGNAGTVSVLQNIITSPGNITTASFAPKIDLTVPSGAMCVAIVDIDGDNKPDLAITAYLPQTFSVIQNLNSGGNLTTNSFGPRIDYSLNGRGHTIAVGDINGDGKPDLIVDAELNSLINVFQNLSTPGTLTSSSLATQVELSTGWNAWGVSVGDLDGDGRPDILFANSYDNNIQIYQNQMPFAAPSAAPAITAQPTNLTVTVNNTAVFSVTATGAQPLIYQWSFNGTNISGATNAVLNLPNVSPAQAGTYSVLVSNIVGTAISSNATLTVFVPAVPPAILSQTPSQVVLLGSLAAFSVTATGSDPLSYFWQRNNVLIPGATNSTYALPAAQLADSGSKFSCLVTNAYGSAVSTNATLKVIDTVSNDLCSGAVVITSYSYSNLQSTVKASSYADPTPDCIDGFGNGVWYQFTPASSGLLLVDTLGSDFDTGLAIYTGGCGSFTEVACDDDSDGVTSALSIPATAGTTYYFLAGGYDGHVGNLVFHLNYLTPPAFNPQPTNIFVVVSSNATLTTAITGTQPITQQWYFNNAPLADNGRISGSTNAVLNIANVNLNDGGNYFIVASNFVGVTTSSVAVLTPVILPPSIIVPPVSQSVPAGSNVTFSVVVGGTPPYVYQWSLNGNLLADDGLHISGSATASLAISNLTTADAGSYSVTVTNVTGSASASASLTVMIPPTITLQPVGRSVPPGLPTIFIASASGIPTPVYQWQLNGTNIPGATKASYTNSAVTVDNAGLYHLVASNSVGVATSADAQLTFGSVAAWGRNLNNESLPPPGLSNVISIAGTYQAGFALRADGTVASWGSTSITNVPANATNAVAIAASADNYEAVALRADGTVAGWGQSPPPALSNVVSVAMCLRYGLALRAEGTVTSWGSLPFNTLPPAGLNHVTAIAVGYPFALALRNDGTVVAWGSGNGTNVPVGLAGVTAIAAGSSHGLALKTNGTVVAWGGGAGTNLPAGLTNIVAISASGSSSGQTLCLAVRANGRVVAWGDNTGNGETNPPAALTNLYSLAVAASPFHGLALVNDGSPVITQPPVGLTAYVGRDVTLQGTATAAPVTSSAGPQIINLPLSYQWLLNGTNVPGATNNTLVLPNIQLANAGNYQLFVSNIINTAISLPAPVTVISNNTLIFLSQTTVSATNVYQAGKVTFNSGTVLGGGPLRYQWFFSPTNRSYLPVFNATNDTLTFDPALASQSGTYYIAVSNLVSGTTSAPVSVRVLFARAWGYQAITNPPVNVTNCIALATGGASASLNGHYLALGSDGKVTSWASGTVNYGETNVSALSNSIVTAIAANYQSSLALKSDGTVYAWGYFGYGQTNPPAGLSSVIAIAAGGYHDLALKADGTVTGWGATQGNNYGQATNNSAATNVVAIAAGSLHSLALRNDGTVVAWGYGSDGSTAVPFGLTNVIAIAAGSGISAALRANGTVVDWGGSIANYPVPSNLSNVVAISASSVHVTALKNDGTVVSWGFFNPGTITSNNFVPPDLTNVVGLASGGDHDIALFGTRAPFFTVQPWNRTVTYSKLGVATITLAAKAAGVQPVRYQWLLNGTNYPNATNDTLTLRGDPPSQLPPGAYQLVASNSYGVTVSKPAKVTLVIPLGEAVDATNLNWTTTGSTPWYGQTNIAHDGFDAARSGSIGGSQETILQTTLVTNFSGQATFWWKVSSEQFFDTLEFRVNGTVQGSISGEVDWQQASFPVPAGTNLLQWRYSKDATFDSGLDAGFVDQFAFVAGPPVITNQPNSVVANLGANVTLSVGAIGVPQLKYQWWKNGQAVGPNASTLGMNNVTRANAGSYYVTVTNISGVATSSVAVVRVNVPQLLGTPQILPDGSLQLTSTDANGGLLQPSDLANFEALVSSDMVNWTPLPNALSFTNGMLQLQDTSRTNFTTRFYRIVEQTTP
ncbi:MAG TPA: immunoglobulin domain-containing protein [Verrucomicrobiae bacterium]|nr:immunoglobulin domain-containing protein [Verrucomicrobiae bacterium]